MDVGETLTVIGEAGATIVTCAEADAVDRAWDTAVTLTVAVLGTVKGAVYKPEAEIVP